MSEIVRDSAHNYTVDGRPVPGVTTILRETKLSSDWSRVPREILNAARDRGRRVHELCWQLAANPAGFAWSAVPDELFGYVEAFETYVRERGITQFAAVERMVWHPKLDYVGTLDAIVAASARALTDLKTGDPDDCAGEIQTAAYVEAWNAEHPDQPIQERECVKLNNDGTYRVHPYPMNPVAFRRFAAALLTFRSQHPSWRTR